MSEKILFGNNVGYKINSYVIKKQIIDYLLDNVDQFKIKLCNITEETNLLDIKNNNFVISPNIVGDDYIFICKKLKDKYYVCLIEKKTINFKNFNKINIISVKIRLKLKSYDGCIFDGRIVNLGGCCAYIISKPFQLYGNRIEVNFQNNLDDLKEFINDTYIIDSNMNCILFKINKFYEVNEINDLVNEIIPKSNFKFSSIDFVNLDMTNTYRYYITSQDNDLKYAYLYGKLINTDVVELFTYDSDNKLRRIGIANIPNIHTSKICNEYVSSKGFTTIYCKFDYRFKKWTPLELDLDNKKDLDSFDDVSNMMLDVISH